jgi:carbonyl reductase 1
MVLSVTQPSMTIPTQMSRKLIVVVTGSSRGLGYGIVKTLAATQHPQPLIIYATSREGAQLDIDPSYGNEVRHATLDITSNSSIAKFLRLALNQDSPNHAVDILINNAGINLDDDYSYERAVAEFDTNYHGTRNMCELFLSEHGGKMWRNPGARIVNVSSSASQLIGYSSQIQTRFRDANMTLEDLDALAAEYLSAVESETEYETGWGHEGSAYAVSKTCVNALTGILARQHTEVLVNCCDPGWVATDIGRRSGEGGKTPEQGAKIPVRLAVGDVGGVSGKFWANGDMRSVKDGEVLEW